MFIYCSWVFAISDCDKSQILMLIIILGCYNVDVGEVIDVLEVYVVSIFRFELCMGAGQ